MTNKRNILVNQNSGFFQDLLLRVKLIWRLMADRRVSFLLKLLPVGALVYLVLPIDLVPEIAIPLVGYLDDAAALWIGMTLFVTLCPEAVVKEHMAALQKVIPGTWRESTQEEDHGEVIDVEARDPNENTN